MIDHQGRRKAKKVGRDQRAALNIAKKIEARLTLGDLGIVDEKRQIPTYGEYAKRWIEITVPATCKPSSVGDYRGILKNHVQPVFGSYRVTDITRLMVKEFLMKKSGKGFASSTVTHLKNVIGGVLNLAVDDGAIAVNPSHRLGRIIREKSLRLVADPLNREELAALLKAFREHLPRHYPMALTLARTGMRLGEVMALQWGDIDFHGRFIHVQRNISKGIIGTPKSGKSRRVDMSMQLSEVLSNLRNQRRIETLQNGCGKVPEWVFISETGTPLIEGHWRERVFGKALEKAGLRRIRIHDLRHGYASMLIQAGESLAYIRDQLGHHSIKVTVDIYGHLAPEGNKAAVDRLDDDAIIRNPAATKTEKGSAVSANPLYSFGSPTGA